jgi:hypothetical protein
MPVFATVRVFLDWRSLVRHLVLTGAALGLAGCMAMPSPQSRQQPTGEGGPDTCGAAQAANLMGAPRSVVEFVDFEQPVRILGPEDVTTMDFNPNRLNFAIGLSGVVTKITCG